MAIQFPVEYPYINDFGGVLTFLKTKYPDLWWRHSIHRNALILRFHKEGQIIEHVIPAAELEAITPRDMIALVVRLIEGEGVEARKATEQELGKWGVNDAS